MTDPPIKMLRRGTRRQPCGLNWKSQLRTFNAYQSKTLSSETLLMMHRKFIPFLVDQGEAKSTSGKNVF